MGEEIKMNEDRQRQFNEELRSSLDNQWALGLNTFQFSPHVGQHCSPAQGMRVLASKLLEAAEEERLHSEAQRFHFCLLTYLSLKALNMQRSSPASYAENISDSVESLLALVDDFWIRLVAELGLEGLTALLQVTVRHLTSLTDGRYVPQTLEAKECLLFALMLSVTAEMIYSDLMPEMPQALKMTQNA